VYLEKILIYKLAKEKQQISVTPQHKESPWQPIFGIS